jgi:predicted nucleotidyltransferase component of viral defense system
MILQSEILQIAEHEGVPPDTIDKNWVLGHFLAGLFSSDWAQENLIFKGGTCLKKCYYKDYRFSEDLDFTLTNPDFVITDKLIRAISQNITDKIGILLQPSKIEIIASNNQSCGYKSIIRFWGANHKRNQQPTPPQRWLTSIKIEIISFEKLIDKPNHKALLDDFSDSQSFTRLSIPCYSISEIIAEKFRSLLQRSYSAPRDYFDLWYILRLETVDWDKTLRILKEKLLFKNIQFNGYQDFFEENRLKSVKREWKNSLQNHIRYVELPDVETVLMELKTICKHNLP